LGTDRLVFGKRVRLLSSPEGGPEMRTGNYLRTMGKLGIPDNEPKDVEIALDTCAEVDTVGVDFAKQHGLKPYIKWYPKLWQSAGNIQQQAKGAYWATWEMTDHQGATRSYRRPFLAIDKGPDDSPLLLSESTLGEIGVNISLRTKENGGNQCNSA